MFLKYRRFSLLGAHGVGKTAIMAQIVSGTFEPDYISSITRTYNVNASVGDSMYSLEIIDTAGQLQILYFPQATPSNSFLAGVQMVTGQNGADKMYEFSIVPIDCCLNIDGWVLVYSVTSEKSFEIVQLIYKQLLHKTGLMGLVPVVLVANKVDLTESRVITSREGSDLAKKWGAIYIESSAQCNMNIREIFTSMVTLFEKRNTPEKKKRRRRSSLLSCAF